MRVSVATTVAFAAAAAAASPTSADALDALYLFPVASLMGPLQTSAASLAYDAANRELYVVSEGIVRVVNNVGMETYAWPQSEELGAVREVAPLEDGSVLALRSRAGKTGLVRCNFRGEPTAEVPIEGLPGMAVGAFDPTRMIYSQGLLYLADLGTTRTVVVADLAAGKVVSKLDIAQVLGLTGEYADYSATGFAVDSRSNQLFTVGPLFKVFVVTPGGQVSMFGRSGSAPGKFGQVAGVAADNSGNIYVTDLLKSAVMVFDGEYRFLGEFGYRGQRPGNLVAPRDLVFADGRLYVSQQARRGVAVYGVANGG
jgi:DNA-binding beta-propeller fold protein YncE